MVLRFVDPVGPTPSPTGPALSVSDPAAAAALQAAFAASAAGMRQSQSGGASSGRVYWGTRQVEQVAPGTDNLRPGATHLGAEYKSIEEASRALDEWVDTPRYQEWSDYLVNLGVIDESDADNYSVLRGAWQDAVEASANLTAAGKQIDPWAAARMLAGGKQARPRQAGEVTGPRTATSTSVNLTDPKTARALINNVLSQQLGRRATDEEIREFTSVLAAAERANPSVTTTTYETDAEGNQTSNSTTTGGVDAQEVITDEAMNLPDYGTYQAGTTYYNALEALLGM